MEKFSPVKDRHWYAAYKETTLPVISCAKRLCPIQTQQWLDKHVLMEMMRLPSVKRALKPLCWMGLSECSRMYITFLEDMIGGGCCVPQSFLRSGASLLGPSNTCYKKDQMKYLASKGVLRTLISFPLLCFIHFDPNTAMVWAVQTNYVLLILIPWPFKTNKQTKKQSMYFRPKLL